MIINSEFLVSTLEVFTSFSKFQSICIAGSVQGHASAVLSAFCLLLFPASADECLLSRSRDKSLMSQGKPSGQSSFLPHGFLRGLEADLRALCADARRRNPEVKEAAERVILSLKEAETSDAERDAADEAASAFCTACETLDPSAGSSALTLQVKIALRAVSCLHKLLTHRALSAARLPEVLDALKRLSAPPIDDNLTLKVLQGVLSLLTVRSYAKALSEDQLSRAFSLLFLLRTSRSSSAGSAASNPLSAISQISGLSDSGVIEQTSKAAFRQVASDLFASAADSAVKTAVEKQAASGAEIPLSEYPSEVHAAFCLFTDLCRAVSSEPLQWVARSDSSTLSSMTVLDFSLALEVLDDGLASNIALFGGQQVFSEALSSRLCPVLHTILRTASDKTTVKSLLGLIVTLNRNYWRILQIDSESILHALATIVKDREIADTGEVPWIVVYAMEAIRCIFHSKPGEPNYLIDFITAFDRGGRVGRLIAEVINVSCDVLNLGDRIDVILIPPLPVNGSMKPFANTITNSTEFLVAIATGFYLEVIKAAGEAVKAGQESITSALLISDTTERAVTRLGKLISESAPQEVVVSSDIGKEASLEALKALAKSIGLLGIIGADCQLDSIREISLMTLSAACKNAIRAQSGSSSSENIFGNRIKILFEVIFNVLEKCRETLGRSWFPIVEALEQLDIFISKHDATIEASAQGHPSVFSGLRPQLDAIFTSTSTLQWSSCHDMISALVQCSRQSIVLMSKKMSQEDQPKAKSGSEIRIFGVSMAERAILHSFERENVDSGPIPCSLWQIVTGHLTSICTDSVFISLRAVALSSLTRLAIGAIPSGNPPFVSHDKVIRPFLDLFTASYTDVRSGSLAAVYAVLEAQGERLSGESAWLGVLKILSTAAGSKSLKSDSPSLVAGESRGANQSPGAAAPRIEMMSEAFRVVQVISDDFMTSLAENALPVWIDVVRLYCGQNEDVNVALTSIGLLWRTADFVAKGTGQDVEDELWVQLFETLKEISIDERPEIRNSAVKTLSGTLSAHSFRLSATAWNGCVARALLPLLEEVMRGGFSGQHDDGGTSGKVRGDVQLLLHHSRDTPRKQWNETRVLALAGVAKVLRTAMPRLAILQDDSGRPLFLMLTDGGGDGLWRKMLRAAGVAAGSRDTEVAVAGVSALLELLTAAGYVVSKQNEEHHQGHATKLGLSNSAPAALGSDNNTTSWISGVMGSADSTRLDTSQPVATPTDDKDSATAESTILLWEAVWSALNEAIGGRDTEHLEKTTEGKDGLDDLKIVDQKALQLLAEGLLESRMKLSDKFTSGSSRMLVQVLMHLALGRGASRSKNIGEAESVLSDVQNATLSGLQRLSFGADHESWVSLVHGLLTIVKEENRNKHKPSALVRRVLLIISSLYSNEQLPSQVKSSELPLVLKIVGGVMLLRNQTGIDGSLGTVSGAARGISHPLWVEAADVVMDAMRCGMSAGPGGEQVWSEFVSLAKEFLYSPSRTRRDMDFRYGSGDWERAEEYDIRLTTFVQEALSQMGTGASRNSKKELVGLLARGAEEGKASGRPRFVRSSQKQLFRLADVIPRSADMGNDSDDDRLIAEESNKQVVETCGRVLGQYIADDQRSGRCPLPAARRAEAVFLLQQLRILNSYDETKEGFTKENIVTLYPRLCECVDSRDEAVRQLARDLLDQAAPGAKDRVRPSTLKIGGS